MPFWRGCGVGVRGVGVGMGDGGWGMDNLVHTGFQKTMLSVERQKDLHYI